MARTWKDKETGAKVLVEKDVHGEPNVFWLINVRTPSKRRKEGGATRVLRRVCRHADRTGATLCLIVLPSPRSEVRRLHLRDWYATFGFRGLEEMVRVPPTPQPHGPPLTYEVDRCR